MLALLLLLLFIPLLIVFIIAVIFGFGALLFALIRFVLPFLVVGAILWLIFGHGDRRKHHHYQWYEESQNQAMHYNNQPQTKKRKDITNQSTHQDDDWSDF
ncbi:hypothetical protein ACNAN0_03615 [Agrilactobacillus fermenti]|uniref:hypothetical protein n=1 Tax=Agrilactobacillus fermenti TaxID=2586909 RepID=UPI001E586239|nr:hypothetical protein [Agrilactobacillus fermenti]MCD2256843.1 hypothetical protein [Agrilactobacillus fermenti]